MQTNVTSPSDDATTVSEILYSLKRKGIRVWMHQGKLHYDVIKGMLGHDDTARLALLKERLSHTLESRQAGKQTEQQLARRAEGVPVPLTYTQTAHWRLYSLACCRSISALTSATHLLGALNLRALDAALTTVVKRHEALRTQIVVRDGMPMQEPRKDVPARRELVDLTGFPPASRLRKAKEVTETLILPPIDLANDSLFRVWVLKLGTDENVLVVSTDHIISDAWSMSVVLRDIFAAYCQSTNTNNARAVLPEIPIQLGDYAVWQRATEMQWRNRHWAYWEKHLRNAQRVSFPSLRPSEGESRVGFGRVPLDLDAELTERLSVWCKGRKTTLAMSVFTAWCALLCRWCDVTDAVVQYQVNGRTSWKIRDTVGYFASKMFLRVNLGADTSFADLLAQLENERLAAYTHADSSRLESSNPTLPFAANSLFNWVPNVLQDELSRLAGVAGFHSCESMPFDYRALESLDMDNEPSFLAFEHASGISAEIQFSRSRITERTVAAFSQNLLGFIRWMLTDSRTPVSAVPIVRGG